MGKSSPSGKGKGGFASSKTRRARKYSAFIKQVNRNRNAEGTKWHKADSTT